MKVAVISFYCNFCKFVMKRHLKNCKSILFGKKAEERMYKCITDEITKSKFEVCENMFHFYFSNYSVHSRSLLPIVTYSCLPPDGTSTLQTATVTVEKHIDVGNVQLAIDDLKRLKKGQIWALPLKTVTKFIDLCIQKNLIQNVSSNVHLLCFIIENAKIILKPLLESYSASGDVEKLNIVRNFMPEFTLKIIDFYPYFVKALIVRNRPEDLLNFLEERCDNNMLISVAALEELVKFPKLQNRTLNLATKYIEKKFYVPVAVIWAHLFTKEMYCEADSLFDMIPKAHSSLIENVEKKVLKFIRKNENIFMGYKFLSFVKQMDVRHRVKERVYGTLLEVLVIKAQYNDAVALVLEAEKQHLELKKHHRSTLLALKEALKKNNIPISFMISS